MARPIKVITAGAEIRAELQRRANAPTSAHRDRFRAKIILLRLEGLKIATVASLPTASLATRKPSHPTRAGADMKALDPTVAEFRERLKHSRTERGDA